jgi:hypothetical protein
MANENDLPLRIIRDAAEDMASSARRQAFGAGVAVVYSKDGKVVRESSTGSIEVIRSSRDTEIHARKRIWKIK